MNLYLSIGPLVALIAGILILIMPRLLNYIIALYLIITGALGLFGGANLRASADFDTTPPAAVQRTMPPESGTTRGI